jgi:TRAP-type uncharacterized transport system fused permease subunit
MSSSIAQSDWWKTGWLPVLLALPAFVVPYTFAYNNALMLNGAPVDLVIGVVSAIAGSYFIGIGVAGYLKKDVKMSLRCVFVTSGILLIIPEIYISLIGLVIATGTWIIAGGLWKSEKAVKV